MFIEHFPLIATFEHRAIAVKNFCMNLRKKILSETSIITLTLLPKNLYEHMLHGNASYEFTHEKSENIASNILAIWHHPFASKAIVIPTF